MNNLVAVIGCLCALSLPLKSFSQPIQPMIQVEEKAKKEVFISMQVNKENYQTPVKVIEGLFKQAGIIDFYIENPEKIEKKEVGIFRFQNRPLSKAIKIISSIYDLDFEIEIDGNEKFYKVRLKAAK
jgi:hypothetical protein